MSKFKVGDKVDLVSLLNTQRVFGLTDCMMPRDTTHIIESIRDDGGVFFEDHYCVYHQDDLRPHNPLTLIKRTKQWGRVVIELDKAVKLIDAGHIKDAKSVLNNLIN